MRIRLSADLFYTVVGGWVMQQKDSTQVFHVGSRNSVSEAVTANDETHGVRSWNQAGNPVHSGEYVQLSHLLNCL